ncbi:MAG: sensor domain-containing diguanylate cyclase [Caldisericia bacterium]|nr:sensor domain-containing diguanylate cyclase [Caldisericia bacterium]
MKTVLSKNELIETENELIKFKIIMPFMGIFLYLLYSLLQFTKYPLLPFFYISLIYLFILIFFHLIFKKIKQDKIFLSLILLSIIEIFLITLVIFYTGGIMSSLFVIYFIIIVSVSVYRIPNIPFIIGIISIAFYYLLIYGQYFKIFKTLQYYSTENINITFPLVFQRTILLGLYIIIFSLFANTIILNLNKQKKVEDLLRDGALLLTSYLGDREAFLKNILKIARELVEGDTASIIELRNGGYKFIAWDKIDDNLILRIEELFKNQKPQNLEEIKETKKLLKFDDVWKVPYWVKVTHLRSYIGVPILFKDKVVAVLNVDSKKPYKFKERDVRNLETFSKIISTMYEKDELIREIKELNLKLENLSITDPLTNLYNRRKLKEIIIYNIEVFLRRNENFQIIMIDLDKFKLINDYYGHIEGDNFLIKFSELLKKCVRKIDFVFRYGGDEFLIILPNTPPPTAEIVVGRINEGFKKEFTKFIETFDIGISYGAINFADYYNKNINKGKQINSEIIHEDILKEVDQSLYYSKKLKRAT